MDFPIGSLATLVLFICVTSGVIEMKAASNRILVLGLAGVLMGNFLSIPLPAPEGTQVLLNVGQVLVPALLCIMFWLEAGAEVRYRTSMGLLAVGLTLYGFTTLLDLEPGLLRNPMLISIPMISVVADLTGRTAAASAMAITGGSIFVVSLRYFELTFSSESQAFLELPGAMLWNTISVGTLASLASFRVVEQLKRMFRKQTEAPACPEVMTEEIRLLVNAAGEQEEKVSLE